MEQHKKSPNTPPVRAKSLRRLADGVDRTKRTISQWPDSQDLGFVVSSLTHSMTKAQQLLREVADTIDRLPSWYPPRKTSASSRIKVGSRVCIIQTYKDMYENLLPGDPLDDLEVLSVEPHKLSFRSKTGVVSVAPKKHVVVLSTPDEQESGGM